MVRRQDKQLPPLVPPTAVTTATEDRRTGLPEAGAAVRRRLCEGPAAVPLLADKKDASRMRRRQTAAAMTVTEEDRRRIAGGGNEEEDPRGRRKKHSQRLCQTRRLDTVHPR